jgi:ankyrin repeat protein
MSFDFFGKEIKEAKKLQDIYWKYRFLDYATRNWLNHAKAAPNHSAEQMVMAIILGNYSTHPVLRHLLARHWVQRTNNLKWRFEWFDDWRATRIGKMEIVFEGQVVTYSQDVRYTLLHVITCFGLPRVVRWFLEESFAHDDNPLDCDNRTPLSLYIQMDYDFDILNILLQKFKQKLNTKDIDSYTPLSHALHLGHTSAAKLLLEQEGIDVNTFSRGYETPLLHATRLGHTDIVKLLLMRNDVKVDHKDLMESTALSLAAEKGHTEIVGLLLDHGRFDSNWPNRRSWTPLALAVACRSAETVKLLLNHDGVDANWPDRRGRTPLTLAALHDDAEIVKLLLEKEGIEVNARDKDSRAPFYTALQYRRIHAVNVLLDDERVIIKNVNAKHTSLGGHTLLSYSTDQGDKKAIKMLLKNPKINVDAKDDHGRTPLSWALLRHYNDIMKLLVDKNASITARDKDGRTPLSLAACYMGDCESNTAPLEFLLSNGAELEERDNAGLTPLALAAQHRSVGSFEFLLEKGSDINTRAGKGMTPLIHTAAPVRWEDGWEEGSFEIMKYILKRKDVILTANQSMEKQHFLWW